MQNGIRRFINKKEKNMKKIYVLVNKYPSSVEPNVCSFIQQLVWSFADLDCECIVIQPLAININREYFNLDYYSEEKNDNGKIIKIIRPKYVSFGQEGKFLQKLRIRLTTFLYQIKVNKVLKKQKVDKQDIIYSHFICPSGVVAAKMAKKYKAKAFMACGESMYRGDQKYGNKYLKKMFQDLSGVVAVSTQNKNFLVNADVVENERIGIFPNGYRPERFFKIDREEARKHMGWDNEKFICGFCGSFDNRKGVLRLEEAVKNLNDVYFACAGKGKQVPTSSKCIFKGPVNNNELVYFYNAIDVFVLPTQNEGCCNAIVEAMACGCPIVSSDKEFNYDILDDSNSIMVDPDNIDEIKEAILCLKADEKKRETLANNSKIKAKKLTLIERGKNILNFFERN